MKALILRLLIGILAFTFGVVIDRVLVAWIGGDVPSVPKPVLAVAKPIVATPITLTPAPAPTPHTIFDFDPVKFNPTGDYFIAGSGAKGFAEFNSLLISTWEENGKLHGDVWIQTHINGHKLQPATFALVTERRLVILSRQPSEEAFEYRFDGEFLHRDLDKFANTSKAVLRGTLTKTKNDRKLTESVVNLRIEQHLGC